MPATLTWTMRRCSSVIQTDQYRLLSSMPGMRLINTRRDPVSSVQWRTRESIRSRSCKKSAVDLSRLRVARAKANRILATKSSGRGRPAPGAFSCGSALEVGSI